MPVTPIDLASLKPNPNPVASLAGDGGLFAALLKETDALLVPKPEIEAPAAEPREEEREPFPVAGRQETSEDAPPEDETPDAEAAGAFEAETETAVVAPNQPLGDASLPPAQPAAAEAAPGRTVADLATQGAPVAAARAAATTATPATPAVPATPADPATAAAQQAAQAATPGGKDAATSQTAAARAAAADTAGASARGDSAAQVVVAQSAAVSRPQATLSGANALVAQDQAAMTDFAPDEAAAQVAGADRKPSSKPVKGAPHAEAQLDRGGQAQRAAVAAAPANPGLARAAAASGFGAGAANAFGLASISGGELPGGGSGAATTAGLGTATGTASTQADPSQAAPGKPTTRPSATEQLATRIQSAVAAGQDKISVKLHPAELGRIEVNLRWSEEGVLRAALVVERPETLELLQRDARGLERVLQDAGLKTDFASLSFDLRGGGHEGRDETRTANAPAPSAGDLAEAGDGGAQPPVRSAHDGQLDLVV